MRSFLFDGEVMTSLVGDTDGAQDTDGAPLSIEMSWAGIVAGDDKSSAGMGTLDGDRTFAMGSSPCNRRLTRGVTVLVDNNR